MRRTPYTAAGIRRVKCFRCDNMGRHQFQICADGRAFRPLCADCDIKINDLVLRFVRDPDRKAKMAAYRATTQEQR